MPIKLSKKQKRLENRRARAEESAAKKKAASAIAKKKPTASKTSGNGKVKKAPIPKVSSMAGVRVGNLLYIPVDMIEINEDQPREGRNYDYIREDLASSIERRGQSNPGKVYIQSSRGKKRFKLVGGEHRYWACERLGRPFWAVVVLVADAKDLFLQAVEDNEGVKPYTDREKAAAIVRMRDTYKMSWENICDRMGGSAQATIKTFYNLGKMPTEVQSMVETKSIPKAVITELAAVSKAHILATARKIQGMPATDARHEVRRAQ